MTWRRIKWLTIIAVGLGAYLVAQDRLPVIAYRPLCHGPNPVEEEIWIDGPLRTQFIWLAAEVLEHKKVPHLIYNGTLYTDAAGGPDGWGFDPDCYHFHLNADTGFATQVATGVTIDEVSFATPQRLVGLLKASELRWGPFPRLDERGNPIYGADDRFFEDCDLFRAAVLKDEAVEPATP